ncbi:MAG: ABC-F family ATP-binding cassette domain-containing protein [Phycisphaerales bacterium]|nr:ABC-F family ATP-binding cassette domain-containing protein [Phycisphaerales bacterium]
MLLNAQGITKTVSLRTLFRGVRLTLAPGERVALIGPNGAGKSTLLKIIAGLANADEGEAILTRGTRAAYVAQSDVFEAGRTVREVVSAGAHAGGLLEDEHECDVVADIVLGKVGFAPEACDMQADALSGGWRKRLAIARGLAQCAGEPDLLLLDEPTNHLDVEGIRWLEGFLKRPIAGRGALTSIFVTHDRQFIENIATRVVELSRAYPQGTLSVDGDYTEFLRRKEEFLAGQAKMEQSLAGQVRKDLAWLGRRAKARRTKSKSRIEASYERIDELADLRARNAAADASGARLDFDSGGRKTKRFIRGVGLAKSIGGRTLFQNTDAELGAGECLALLGPNGSGKTTFIRVLTGETPADAGTIRLSDPAPKVVIFSQHRTDFEPTTTLQAALCPISDQVRFRGQAMHITAWSRRFLFRDEQLAQPVSTLSGGELARIHIARIMLEPADVLVLDEPTNDLDIATLEVLEESLEEFPGSLLLVTHDRAMMDRLATSVLALDGMGNARTVASLDQALAWLDAQGAEEWTSEANAGRAREPAEDAKPTAAPEPVAPKKLSYKEQREYDAMEARIMEAEARLASASARVAEPSVAGDHRKMAEACAELDAAQAEVDTLYARWAELESRAAPRGSGSR